MEFIENWMLLVEREKEKTSTVSQKLTEIQESAINELFTNGHRMIVNGEKACIIAGRADENERLELAAYVGRTMFEIEGDLFEKKVYIGNANFFPNCIFIALASIIENLDGSFNAVFPDKKMKVACHFRMGDNNIDPVLVVLPMLSECYPWIDLSLGDNVEKTTDDTQLTNEKAAPAVEKKRRFFSRKK